MDEDGSGSGSGSGWDVSRRRRNATNKGRDWGESEESRVGTRDYQFGEERKGEACRVSSECRVAPIVKQNSRSEGQVDR